MLLRNWLASEAPSFSTCPLPNVLQSVPTLLPVQYGGYVRIRDRLTQAEAAAKVCLRWKGKLGLLQLVWTAAWPASGAHAVPQEVGSIQAGVNCAPSSKGTLPHLCDALALSCRRRLRCRSSGGIQIRPASTARPTGEGGAHLQHPTRDDDCRASAFSGMQPFT